MAKKGSLADPFLSAYNTLKDVVKRAKEFSNEFEIHTIGTDHQGIGIVTKYKSSPRVFFVLQSEVADELKPYEGFTYDSTELAAFIRLAKKTGLEIYREEFRELVFRNDGLLCTAKVASLVEKISNPLKDILELPMGSDEWNDIYYGDIMNFIDISNQVPLLLDKKLGHINNPAYVSFTKEQFPSLNKDCILFAYNKTFKLDDDDSLETALFKISDKIMDVYLSLAFVNIGIDA